MSLKSEIDRLIASEKKRLESRDNLHDEYCEEQKERFMSMHILLKEIENSFGREYMHVEIKDERMAFIEVGPISELSKNMDVEGKIFRDVDYRCFIEPNRELVNSSSREGFDYSPRPGFRIEDKDAYGRLGIQCFESESDLAQYLIKTIAKLVAEYVHRG